MSRDRYLNILRVLHFSDNKEPCHSKLAKIQKVICIFKKTFSINFNPFRSLCIDESLVLFKGRLGFKQYIPSKRSRFGIKLFLLCDVETGYILDFIVYAGSETEKKTVGDFGVSGAVVTTLMEKYLNKGHILYVDNWYTSPDLFMYLHQNKTNACGTVKLLRRGLPKFTTKLNVGERETYNSGPIMALKWKDKRDVHMLTTEHRDTLKVTTKITNRGRELRKKPQCVVEYNHNMGAVDRSDMMIHNLQCIRRSTRWYKKLFFHFVDLALLNAHALFLTKNENKITLPKFQLEVIRQLIEKYLDLRVKSRGGRPSTGDVPSRLSQRHFPKYIPPIPNKKNPSRICFVCKHTTTKEIKRKETRFMCQECDVALCVVPCFEDYHSKQKF